MLTFYRPKPRSYFWTLRVPDYVSLLLTRAALREIAVRRSKVVATLSLVFVIAAGAAAIVLSLVISYVLSFQLPATYSLSLTEPIDDAVLYRIKLNEMAPYA